MLFSLVLVFLTVSIVESSSAVMATPRPIQVNSRYMAQLADAGLILPPTPTPATTDPWHTDKIHGVAYLPSYCLNAACMWLDYDGITIRRELGFAAAASANAVRVPLSWAAYSVNASATMKALDDFVTAASAASLGVVFTVFDGLGDDVGINSQAIAADPTLRHSTDYFQNPGFSQINNITLLPSFDAYISVLTTRFGNDMRVIGWDAYFQPILCEPSTTCPTFNFLSRVMNALHTGISSASSFLTISVLPGASACDAQNLPPQNRTVIAFENFNGNTGAVGGDGISVQSCGASLNGAPALLTGALGRNEVPPSNLCETLFEAYGTPFIDIPAHPRFGVILPWLMIGKDIFTRDPLPNQGLIWPNGTWFNEEEQACFIAAIPPTPPGPPPPPPAGVNFTTPDGLSIGLRNSTRAIQFLQLTNDDRWFSNFSFVPPLWGYIPSKPHRDFQGCHHVGDATFRVQPSSETNASNWAFYSTAGGGNDFPAVPLPHDNNIYDFSNLTDAASHGNQIDTRFPLGLIVLRSIEPAPGAGAPGFAIRFNLSVPTTATEGVRIGGFGYSLISDSFFGGTNNTAIAFSGSFLDAHPGLDSGFVTFTRADGSRTMIVTPCNDDAGGRSKFEAWRPILEDPVPPNEGMWEWTILSSAWASEWANNAQSPYLTFPDDADHKNAWPQPLSPWPSWHLAETVHRPSPRPWNPPTSITLSPGQSTSFALCFSLPPPLSIDSGASGFRGGPRSIENGLAAAGRPVLVAVPGTILGSDMTTASLFILPPPNTTITNITSDDPDLLISGTIGVPGIDGFIRVPLILPSTLGHGRARLVINFENGAIASVHYFILPPLSIHSANYGIFAASTSWLPRDFIDPFGRSGSFMPWDREDKVHVLQDGRPFVVGLSDDAGAGANLGMAAKLASAPHAGQLALLDEYVNVTLLGVKTETTATPPFFSLQDPISWHILMTVWYYEKSPMNTSNYYQELDKCKIGPSWCSFNSPWCDHASGWCAVSPPRDPSISSGWPSGWTPNSYRQYNFPHQIAVYHALYLAARNSPRITTLRNTADWYLNAAVQSIYAANCVDITNGKPNCLITVGLMDGTIFREVLRLLKAEGKLWESDATKIEALQRERVLGNGQGWEGWNTMDNPAGSEFSWDSTGQEEVSIWGAYFNATDNGWMHGELNSRTVDSILGYTQVLPTFAFSGSSYGMGDFSNNAKWMVTDGWEREGGHYRSGLNSIPLIERYRSYPDDFHLLQVGIAGLIACLPNIDSNGAPSMAFHTHPMIMEHDPYSGDHGLAFFGHSLNAGSYFHNHSSLGLLCFLCDASVSAGITTITPRDTYHIRAYIEPLGLWLVAEAGRFTAISINVSGTVTVIFESQDDAATAAGASTAPYYNLRLRVEAPASAARPYSFTLTVPTSASIIRDAFEFAPNSDASAVTSAVISWTRKLL